MAGVRRIYGGRLRIDTPIEDYYRQGGILPFVFRQLLTNRKFGLLRWNARSTCSPPALAVPRGDRQPGPVWPPAQRHGRRHLVAIEGLRRCALDAKRCRFGLYLCPGADREPRVDYRANCGNMSSAVGRFAVDEGLLRAEGETVTVRIYNTNTKKLIHATFPLCDNLPEKSFGTFPTAFQ
jgi:PrpF protein